MNLNENLIHTACHTTIVVQKSQNVVCSIDTNAMLYVSHQEVAQPRETHMSELIHSHP